MLPGWGGGQQAAERKLLNVSQLGRGDGLGKHETRLAYTLMGRADAGKEEGSFLVSVNMHVPHLRGNCY